MSADHEGQQVVLHVAACWTIIRRQNTFKALSRALMVLSTLVKILRKRYQKVYLAARRNAASISLGDNEQSSITSVNSGIRGTLVIR
jgi:serine/threonine protein phosphatase PrpC